MCKTIIAPDGDWISNAEELRSKLSVELLDIDGLEEDDLCFCGVDVEQALDRHGIEYEVADDGFIEIVEKDEH